MTCQHRTPARRHHRRILAAAGWSTAGAAFLVSRCSAEVDRLVDGLANRRPLSPPPPRSTPLRKATIPAALRWAVFRRDGYRCQHCGTDVDLTADHVIPEALGGPTELDNLQTLCRPCNSRKGIK